MIFGFMQNRLTDVIQQELASTVLSERGFHILLLIREETSSQMAIGGQTDFFQDFHAAKPVDKWENPLPACVREA
jgi:hypothetical protein